MVENYFEEYRDRLNAHTSDKLQEMLQYYERVWINGYTPTRYFVGSLVNETNNLVEADNKQLKSDIKTHPNLIDFIGMLQWYHIVERIINYLFFIYSERLKKRNSIKEREYLDAKGNRAVQKVNPAKFEQERPALPSLKAWILPLRKAKLNSSRRCKCLLAFLAGVHPINNNKDCSSSK